MGGFLILDDGRAWAPASWAFDAGLEQIAEVLTDEVLRAWLLEQRCSEQGPGMGRIDVRELTPHNRELLLAAIPVAIERARAKDGSDWNDPSWYPQWLDRFELLGRMVESVARGEPPETLNPQMRSVIPPTGERSGPGW